VEQYDKKIMRKTNVLGTKILLEHLGRNMKIKKFIFLSSVGVFGQNFIKKIIGEEDECRPQNLYEKTKFEAETYVKAKIQNGFPAIIIRPSIIYGPRAKSNNNFYRVVRAINRGYFYFIGHQESFYNIIYIEDVIKAILDIAQIENTENTKIFTVNESIEWRELISLIQKHLSSNKKIYTLPKILGFILSLIGSLFRLLMLPAPLTHTAYKILTCQSVYQTKNLDEISKESDKIGHRRGIDKTINYMKSAHIL
jgi:nucleoside-diphosphate-sugar epimerase